MSNANDVVTSGRRAACPRARYLWRVLIAIRAIGIRRAPIEKKGNQRQHAAAPPDRVLERAATTTNKNENRLRSREKLAQAVRGKTTEMDFTTSEKANVQARSKSHHSTHAGADAVAAGAPVGLSTGNAVVDRIGQMHFEGNIIDHRWLGAIELRFKNGKLNMAAVLVLADVIYWHRPTIIRDERTNQVIEVRKKFSGAEFYKDYQLWADSLGLTKRQVQDAIAFLVDAGLVHREARSITLGSGLMSNNLPLITPIAEAIAEMTYGLKSSTRTVPPVVTRPSENSQAKPKKASRKSGRQRETPHVETGDPSRHNVKPLTPQRETSTENTAETSAEIKQTTTARARADVVAAVVSETSFLSAPSAPPSASDYRVLDGQQIDTSGAADPWEVEAISQRLFEHGIPKKTASRLASASPEMCSRQLEWLPANLKDQESKKRPVKNVAGYLRRAIEDGYAKPASLQNTEREQEAAQLRRAAVEAEERQRHADRDREEQQRSRHDVEIVELQNYYETMTQAEREAIDEQARRRCAGLAAMGLSTAAAFEAEKRMILRRELGFDVAAA